MEKRGAKWEKLRVGFLLTTLEIVCYSNRCSFKQQLSLWMDVHAACTLPGATKYYKKGE